MINKLRRVWLPQSLAELAVWFANFAKQLADFAAELDIDAATLAWVNEANATIQWAAQADAVSEANGKAFRNYRDILIYGVRNSPQPSPPPTSLPTPPAELSVAIIDKLVRLVDTIEDADGYNLEIGAALGIIPIVEGNIAPEEWTTTLSIQDEAAFELIIKFVKGESDGIMLESIVGAGEEWTKEGNFQKSPISLTVTPTVPNTPVAVKLRGRLLKGNKPVGEYTQIYETVARP